MTSTRRYRVRPATTEDVDAIVEMLADDQLGSDRERSGDPAYVDAFARILASPGNELVVLSDEETGEAVGTLQVTFIPYLSHRGSPRALVEAVRVRSDLRGTGLGHQLMQWAIDRAKQEGCAIVQLTSNKARSDAHRFYEGLGFERSHDGFKLYLE